MQVTNKVHVAPAPPVSKALSTEQVTQAKEKELHPVRPANGVSYETKAIVTTSDRRLTFKAQPPKRQNKIKRNKESRLYRTFGGLLSHILVFSVVIYALVTCPNPTAHPSPLCRGLYEFRRSVLDPYVLPKFYQVITHPSIAPYAEKAQNMASPVVTTCRNEWNHRVVPQWSRRIVPWWNKSVAPQLRQLDRQLEPYRTRLSIIYYTYATPSLRKANIIARRLRRTSQLYVFSTITKLRNWIYRLDPHAIPGWSLCRKLVLDALDFVRKQKNLFVDPHVARLWDKVIELSNGEPSTTTTTNLHTEKSIQATETVKSTNIEEQWLPLSSDFPSSTNEILQAEVVSETVQTVVPQPSSSITRAASVTPTIDDESFNGISLSTAKSTASVSLEKEQTVPEPELVEFINLIGLNDNEHVPDDPPDELREVTGPTEEELAEQERARREAVAERRADIEGRHTQWESEMEEAALRLKPKYIQSLESLRTAALHDLKHSPEVRSEVDGFVAEAEKLSKGSEVFLKYLESGDEEDRLTLWRKMMNKVQAKFDDRTHLIEDYMHDWYARVVDNETREAQNAALIVREIGDRAQEDVGMDYAWLDDVDVDDWTRYHDLMRRVRNFTDFLTMIQNGTHPESPVNPLLPALADLQRDLLDVATGFLTHLKQLDRHAERTFEKNSDQDQQGLTDADSQEHHYVTSPSDPDIDISPPAEDENVDELHHIVLGRSKDEILSALARGEELGETAGESGTPKPEEEGRKTAVLVQ